MGGGVKGRREGKDGDQRRRKGQREKGRTDGRTDGMGWDGWGGMGWMGRDGMDGMDQDRWIPEVHSFSPLPLISSALMFPNQPSYSSSLQLNKTIAKPS